MSDLRRKALVICPGRGVYNKPELGYFARHHAGRKWLIDLIDDMRTKEGQPTVRSLDESEKYSHTIYSRGDNASSLIFACSYADFLAIDRNQFEIVGVTGNSMGWYTALACAGVLSIENSVSLVNEMGRLTHNAPPGGQIVYPLVDENWKEIPGRRGLLLGLMEKISADGLPLFVSIELGGMILFAGTEDALALLDRMAPRGPGRLPLRLQNHGPFHSPLMSPVSVMARSVIPVEWFKVPASRLVDGKGRAWMADENATQMMWEYTIGAQVVEPYLFTEAIINSVRLCDPDVIIILGPGETLGGAVAQCLIQESWRGLSDKAAFVSAQIKDPLVLAMGRPEQRAIVENVS
jgi:acyl transferase domain-containing protein